jgi:major vault protein
MSDRQRERDLVLAPNEFAFISDQTKGNINVYVGPYKTSLANTDQPVYFDSNTKRFVRCTLEDSMTLFSTAPEGWYLVLKNPAKDGSYPTSGTVNNLTPLGVGHKVNIAGPASFALWPGQMAQVVKGHYIRLNQYLVVRVYDEEAARENWSKAVIKLQDGASEEKTVLQDDQSALIMGEHLIIDGNSVSFYIPPTGVEVVRDEQGNYIRQAVTLERLEYCMLLDEDGQKRFIQGPAVVFPKPTEVFVEKKGLRKFKAIELNEISGLYVKVIASYSDNGQSYNVGQELFITGKEQMIYFPRPEHAVIRYGDQEIHHALAIPAGEGRYVMNRESGQIRLVKGPTMFLADPRKEVIVRRILDDSQVQLWFPGNQEALKYNQHLKQMLTKQGHRHLLNQDLTEELTEDLQESIDTSTSSSIVESKKTKRKKSNSLSDEEFGGDQISRKSTFTQPRTLTLDTKYEGAVTIGLWTGYAALVVSKSGHRKVIVGPQTYLLEYDESLEPMALSSGIPKSDLNPIKTSYLRVLHNKISDQIQVETKDLCQVTLQLSYRVNFEGESDQWFNVENYVKFLTDHMRSVIRNAVKGFGVQEFYSSAIDIIRDTVLGNVEADQPRKGRTFTENGMRIYDVEVLDVLLGNQQIEELLMQAQHDAVHQTIVLHSEKQKRDLLVQQEEIKRELEQMKAQTQLLALENQVLMSTKNLEVEVQRQKNQAHLNELSLQQSLKEEETKVHIQDQELRREKAQKDQDLSYQKHQLDLRLAEVKAEVDSMVAKAGAVSPDLIAALQAFSDRALVEKVSASMSPLAILGGKSVADVIQNLLKGTTLENTLSEWSGSNEEKK